MLDPIGLLFWGVILFLLVTLASFVGTMLALRYYHEGEPPSASAAVEDVKQLRESVTRE